MPTVNAAPADDIILCQPTGEKKRKEVDAAANNESGPPKKRKRYECSAEGCSNQVQKGGVCWRHGAKVEYKRCSVDGCSNQVIKGGVCIKHGAKRKRCSVDGCSNQVVKRGVCRSHGANLVIASPMANGFSGYCGNQRLQPLLTTQQQQQTLTRAASASYSLNVPRYPQQQLNNNYYCDINTFLYSDWTPCCSIKACTVKASYHGYCGMHGQQLAALLDQANIQRGYIQEGGNLYNAYEAEDDINGAELESRADLEGEATTNVKKESMQMAEPDSSVEAMVATPKETADENHGAQSGSKSDYEEQLLDPTDLRNRFDMTAKVTTKVDALNETLAKVTRNETATNAQFQKMTADFAAERASLQSKVEELTAKLEQATRNEAAMNAPLETMTDELEATRTSSESAREKLQSKIDELLVMLDGRQNKVNGKSEAIGRLPLELTRKYTELNAKSTEAAALNVRLVEQTHGGDIAKDSKEDIIRINSNKALPISYEHFCQSISSMDASVAQDDSQMYDDGNNDYEKSKDGIVVKEGELADDEYVAGRLKGVKEEELTDDEA